MIQKPWRVCHGPGFACAFRWSPAFRRRALGYVSVRDSAVFLPPPLRGRAGVGGERQGLEGNRRQHGTQTLTPTPTLPRKGGGNRGLARADLARAGTPTRAQQKAHDFRRGLSRVGV